MKKVLVVIDNFLPGHRYGGPVTSVHALCTNLSNCFFFSVLTSNHDFGSREKYPLKNDCWLPFESGQYSIMYVDDKKLTSFRFLRSIASEFDKILLCGAYSRSTLAMLLALKKANDRKGKVIVAPMGVFLDGAMAIKAMKKKIFIWLARLLGLYRNVLWSCTDEAEVEAVKKLFGGHERCLIAQDMVLPVFADKPSKAGSVLRCVFISRICVKKNLKCAIEALVRCANETIILDIFGPIEDRDYYAECMNLVGPRLKGRIHYAGDVQHSDIVATFSRYDVFLFPTMSENFGHVIFESLCGGCIPLISNETPWKWISRCGAGFVIDGLDPKKYSDCLSFICSLGPKNIDDVKAKCIEAAKQFYNDSVAESGYHQLFEGT